MSLFLIGPSGVGKSTLKKQLLKDFSDVFAESVSCTTRLPREGEKHGTDYYFLNQNEFQKKVSNKEFLEWEEIHGQFYGTLFEEIERIKSKKLIPIFDIDLKGAENLVAKLQESRDNIVYILPPNLQDLEQRLKSRHTESDEQIKLRLERAAWELNQVSNYSNVIVNHHLDSCYQELVKFLKNRYGF